MSGNETIVLGPGGSADPESERIRDEIFAGLIDRLNAGEAIDAAEVEARWPGHAAAVLLRLKDFEALGMDGAEDQGAAPTERAFGDYAIILELGRGGMGVVYEAIEKSMERRVALKILPPGLLLDARSVTRFQREAKIAGKLRHPNIVAVYATGVHEKTPYIAMELVEGETLDRILARRRESPAEMDLSHSIITAGEFAGAAEGLQHAHSLGILHRDVKPSNLILDREGKLRILDFGLARLEGQESLTASREIVGTPRYMSPEVARGSSSTDHRTDIFSLGASLYEALTSTPPFPGATAEDALSQILHHEPRPPRAHNARIPKDLETIVLKCLEKSPADRYGTAEALAQDLRRFARGDPIEARPQSAVEKAARRIRRNKGKLAVAAAILALLLSAAFFARKSELEQQKAHLAEYDNIVAGAVARSQMGMFAGQASQLAWAGQGYDVTRLREGMGFDELEAKLFSEVIPSLEKAIHSVPERSEGRYQLARILVYQGQLDRAAEELRLAAERGSTPAMVLLASILDQRGQPQEAAELKKRALESPEGLWAEALLEGDRSALEGKWPEAAKAYEKAIEIGKGSKLYAGASAEIYMSSGVARLLAGDKEGARSCFQTAAALRPGALEPEMLVGIAYRSEGKAAEADDVFEKLHARCQAARNTRGANASSDVACWVAMFYWSRFHDPERALKWADRIPPSYERELWRATCLSTLRPGPEAVEAARKLRELNPEAALSYFIAATAYLGTGDFPSAAEMASKATERAPRSSMPLLILAQALRAQGKPRESQAALLKATEVEPEAAAAHYYLGLSFLGQGLLEEASRSLEKAIGIAEREGAAHFSVSEAHFRLGSIRQALGRRDAALPAFRSAVDVARAEQSWNPQAHLALASLLFEKGERIEAIRVIEAALDSPVADDSVASRLPGQLEEYSIAVLPELPIYRAADIALRRQARTEIIGAGARWRFHRGMAPPSPGLEWTRREFDDSGWEEGPSGFGYGDGDDATVIDDMRGQFTTLYIRTRLSLPVDLERCRVLLTVASDDGFVAYWDGTEIGRHHAPDGAPVPHDAKASEEAAEPLLPVELALDAALLSGAGEHVLAIQGLNVSLESSDFSLLPVLRAEKPEDAAGARRVLESFQGAADPSRDAGRLAYLRGKVLEAEGSPEKAAAEFAIAAGLDPGRPEPAIALARRLRAMGRAREANARLEPLLKDHGSRALWELWLAISFVDLKSSPGELLLLTSLPPSPEKPRSIDSGPQASRVEDVRWLLGALSRREPVRIRSGGGDWTSPAGVSWSRDRFYAAGQLFGNGQGRFEGGIQETENDPIYQTERYFQALATHQPGYSVPMPPGRYRVTLHFAEIFHHGPGERVFDILLEGQTVLEAFEPGAVGFATAVKKSFEVEVKDGFLEIGFRGRVGHPKVSAIEIEPIAP